MTKKINLFYEFVIFAFLTVFAGIIALGGNFTCATLDGIKLWVACVLPALFPYLFITTILSSLSITAKFAKKLSPLTIFLFKTGGFTGYAFFISLISGYPLGAKTVSDLKKQNLLTDVEAVRASAFCSTSSPMFLIGSVGNVMFRSNLFGICLFLTHVLSAFVVGLIFSFYKKNLAPEKLIYTPNQNNRTDNLLYESVYSAVISVLVVGGIITIFYLLTEVLIQLKILSLPIDILGEIIGDKSVAECIVLGLFECTRALKSLAISKFNAFTLPIASAVCGFGGLSVIIQSIAYLKNAKIKTAPFILAKIISAVLNFIFGIIISLIIF